MENIRKKDTRSLFSDLRSRNYYKGIDILNTYGDFYKDKNVKSNLICGNIAKKVPKLTVAIPTYKRPNILEEAIKSVLNQIGNCEYDIVIVSNNNDDDEINYIKNMIHRFNSDKIFFYVNEKNLGHTSNWNRAIELSRTEWVCLLADDDLLKEDFCITILNAIKKKKTYQAFACLYDTQFITSNEGNNLIDTSRVSRKKIPLYNLSKEDYFGEMGIPGMVAVVYKRKNFIKLGGFNEEFATFMDELLNYQYTKKFGMTLICKHLCTVRQGGNYSQLRESKVSQVNHAYFFESAVANDCKLLLKKTFVEAYTYIRYCNSGMKEDELEIPIDVKTLNKSYVRYKYIKRLTNFLNWKSKLKKY